jgi:hypothetical protein
MRKLASYRLSTLVPAAVFALFFLVGLTVHTDYGVSFDEPAVRSFGNTVYNYVFAHGPEPTQFDWIFFNPIVQVFMRGVEVIHGLTDGRDIWNMRHLVTFLLFFFTIVCFYRIALKHFKTWKLPFLGSVMFMLTPRLFAHGFYNPKDIPALFFFTLCALTMVRMLETKSTARIVMHALTTGLLISVRIFGLLMPVLTLLFLWMGPRKR